MRALGEAGAVSSRGGSPAQVVRPGVGPANRHPTEVEPDGLKVGAVILNGGARADFRLRVIRYLSDLTQTI
jgi:hypothetical protein